MKPLEGKEREEAIKRLEDMGILVPGCSGCKEKYEHPTLCPFAPDHIPSKNCKSGKRPHCTCDTCF